MKEKLINDITNIINIFNKQLEQHLPFLDEEVNLLITNKTENTSIIENTLDILLSLTMHGVADNLFIKLLEYYKTINPDGALYYWNEYDSDDEEIY